MSLRLQTLCLAIFDAVMVHMLTTLSPDGKWLRLKAQILDALTHRKDAKTLAILQTVHAGTDVLFLQEVRTASCKALLPDAFAPHGYTVHAPLTPSKADQNSVIVLRDGAFDLRTEQRDVFQPEGTGLWSGDLEDRLRRHMTRTLFSTDPASDGEAGHSAGPRLRTAVHPDVRRHLARA